MQSRVIRLAIGIPLVLMLVGVGIWGAWSGYRKWNAGHMARNAAVFLGLGETRSAALSAQASLAMERNNVEAMRVLATIAEQSRNRAAVEYRRNIVKLQPQSEEDVIALARCEVEIGELDHARTTLQGVVRAKDTAAYHAVLARIATVEKDPGRALRECREAVRLSPNEESYQMELGLVCLDDADAVTRKQGREILEKLRQSPNYRIRALRALITYETAHGGEADDLRSLARELRDERSATFADQILYLDALHRLNDPEYTKYLAEMEQTAADRPQNFAMLLSWMNHNELTDRVVAWEPKLPAPIRNDPAVAIAIADAHVGRKDWASLRESIADSDWNGLDYLRHVYLARVFREQDDALNFRSEWTTAMTSAGSNSDKLVRIAETVSNWGWDHEATTIYLRLADDPASRDWALRMVYDRYAEAGDTAGLCATSMRLLEVHPDDAKIQNNVAQLSLLLQNNPERAHKMAREVYLKNPTDPECVSTYAYSLYLQKRTGKSLEVMNALTEEQLREPSVAAYYGLILAAAGQVDKAREFLNLASQARLLPEEKELMAKTEESLSRMSPGTPN